MSQDSNVPTRETQISTAYNGLKASIEYAEKVSHSLGARIESVLSPCPPGEVVPDKKSMPTAPHAAMLSDMAIRIEKLASYIESIQGRVEL
jgi:hypothetical protein